MWIRPDFHFWVCYLRSIYNSLHGLQIVFWVKVSFEIFMILCLLICTVSLFVFISYATVWNLSIGPYSNLILNEWMKFSMLTFEILWVEQVLTHASVESCFCVPLLYLGTWELYHGFRATADGRSSFYNAMFPMVAIQDHILLKGPIASKCVLYMNYDWYWLTYRFSVCL